MLGGWIDWLILYHDSTFSMNFIGQIVLISIIICVCIFLLLSRRIEWMKCENFPLFICILWISGRFVVLNPIKIIYLHCMWIELIWEENMFLLNSNGSRTIDNSDSNKHDICLWSTQIGANFHSHFDENQCIRTQNTTIFNHSRGKKPVDWLWLTVLIIRTLSHQVVRCWLIMCGFTARIQPIMLHKGRWFNKHNENYFIDDRMQTFNLFVKRVKFAIICLYDELRSIEIA